MSRVLRIIGLIVLVLMAVAVGAGFHFLHSPSPIEPKLTQSVHRETIKVGDRERSFLAYTPADLPPGSPLVIVLHGSLMDGNLMRQWTGYEFDRLADERKFAVLYPDGYKHNWNDCRKRATYPAKRENIDDVGFLQALIAHLQREAGIDPKRVYLFGYSNGGSMAIRMALEHPDEVAAITAVSVSLPVPDDSSCPTGGHSSPVMVIDGTSDPINPFDGGTVSLFGFASRGRSLSAMKSLQILAKGDGATSPPTTVRLEPARQDDPTWVERTTWSQHGTVVAELDAVHGGGHVVPQPVFRFPRLLGRTTSAINAPQAAIDFYGVK
jgi:polyhydroxybutyrate depolymerase